MTGGDKAGDTANATEKLMRRWYVMPAVLLVLIVLSVSMLAWVYRIDERERANYTLSCALMDLQILAATSHLWFEEAITAGMKEDMEKSRSDMDEASRLCGVILEGGETEHGPVLKPLRDPELRAQCEEIRGLFSEFRRIALQRYEDPKAAGVQSVLDQRFDDVFMTIMERARTLEHRVEQNQEADLLKSRHFMFGTLLVWLFILVGTTIGFWRQELGRIDTEIALLKSNRQLESQAEELRRHREQLREAVEERTAELTTANMQLQKEITERNEGAKALYHSEKQFRMLVETMDEGLVISDKEGALTYANNRFCELLGYSRGELLGRRRTDLVCEGDRKSAEDQMEGCRRGEPSSRDLAFRKKDGQTVHAVLSSRPIRGEDGEFLGSLAVIRDKNKNVS